MVKDTVGISSADRMFVGQEDIRITSGRSQGHLWDRGKEHFRMKLKDTSRMDERVGTG